MPVAASDVVTAEELLRMSGDQRYELVRGELRPTTPAGSRHGLVAMRIAASLYAHAESHQLGVVFAAETGFRIASDPDTVRAPDVAFVCQQRAAEVGAVEGFWPGAPDLAVEVVSPGDTFVEVEKKVESWLEAGCRVVLVVNPRRGAVAVHRSEQSPAVLSGDQELTCEDVVPGWKLPLSKLIV
jgi:Uma2 family endonuclease